MPPSTRKSRRHPRSNHDTKSPTPPGGFACDLCSVPWSGPEADCPHCGRPADQANTSRPSTLHTLLHDASPDSAPRASPATQSELTQQPDNRQAHQTPAAA